MEGLTITDLEVRYGSATILHQVNLTVPAGSVLGVAGESGSGKSTLARAVVGLTPPVGGRITLGGRDLSTLSARERRGVQLVFQDANSSLDPRMTAGRSIAEALSGKRSRTQRREAVAALLRQVRLDPQVAGMLPRRLSGGQRQRVAVARALAAEPSVLIADEITSALDISVQAAVLNLLRDLHRDLGLTIVFISHNLAAVRYVCTDVAILYHGRVVETGPAEAVLSRPTHPYTTRLLASVPELHRPDARDEPAVRATKDRSL